ncbi:MAG: UvrD-helicase domain-containing protein [Flaviflexus sp.]|nr:UvrD-helicase domain-containing protein [Flaviflexus sp.]
MDQHLSALDQLRARVAAQSAREAAPQPAVSARSGPEGLLEGLNEQQRAAVTHTGGPLLVVAGAGSGKTRVLTHRIAYLIETGRARPGEILAITFTNKAAREMSERLATLLPGVRSMWISTFHSACVRILRKEHGALDLRSSFTIYDSADSQRLMSQVCRDEGIDPRGTTPKALLRRISDLKNELITPARFAATITSEDDADVAKAYAIYQRRLAEANALDFDDIIMRTVELLRGHEHIAEHYRRRFRHILVDEYQDTNHAQYVLVKLLTGSGDEAGELTVVGDADQSIYAFRGATIRNIEEFEEDFPDAKTILLEQNYRSTQNILTAANAVIANNPHRRAKKLWSDLGAGEKVIGYVADSEHDEARFIVDELQNISRPWSDVAIFYRTNAQSRALEERLMRAGIPYRLIGGTRFYERREIKDALAYLHAVDNPDDTVSLRRIFNTPRRGLGAKAEEAIASHARAHSISFGAALDDVGTDEGRGRVTGLTARAESTIIAFRDMLAAVRDKSEKGARPADLLDELMTASDYLPQLRASTDPQDEARVENLSELHAIATEFAEQEPEGSLGDFLERVALVSDADQIPDEDDGAGEVTLMTVHTAKGLEFPVVFVTGLEDGTFPHIRSLESSTELAEERRLAYVALTRAQQRLYLSRAAVRASWGAPQELPPSRFLDEIPEELLEWRQAFSSSEVLRRYTAPERAIPQRRSAKVSPGRLDGGAKFGTTGARLSKENEEKLRKAKEAKKKAAEASAAQRKAAAEEARAKREEAEKAAEEALGKLADLKPGDTVIHRSFGSGTVEGLEGKGRNRVARVSFGDKTKRLMLAMAPLSLPGEQDGETAGGPQDD